VRKFSDLDLPISDPATANKTHPALRRQASGNAPHRPEQSEVRANIAVKGVPSGRPLPPARRDTAPRPPPIEQITVAVEDDFEVPELHDGEIELGDDEGDYM
jgi:hypothetical protein